MGIFGDIIDILTTPLPRGQDMFPEGSILDTGIEMVLEHNRPRPPGPVQIPIQVRSQAPPPGVPVTVQVNTRSQQPMSAPPQMMTAGLFPSFEGGMMPTGFNLPFIDIVPEGQGVSLFKPGGLQGAVPKSLVIVPNPVTGKPTFFGNRGKPILFSGDFAAVRRVKRVAARASKSLGSRRRR